MKNIIKKRNFSEIINSYEVFFFDLYGVTHNGVKLFPGIINILKRLKILKKNVVFISNAPRKSIKIKKFLKKLGLSKNLYLDVISSGDITYEDYLSNLKNKKYYFIGANKDKDFCKGLKIFQEKKLETSNFILNLGLNEGEKINKYSKILHDAANLSLPMICVNPDLEVIRGKKKEFCAGSLALQYEKFGGKVKYFGKPYPNVYSQSIKVENKKVLCIGYNLNTDNKGANIQNFSSLLISNGIHREEMKNKNLNDLFKEYNVNVDYIQNRLKL